MYKKEIVADTVSEAKNLIKEFLTDNKDEIKVVISIDPIASLQNGKFGVVITYIGKREEPK